MHLYRVPKRVLTLACVAFVYSALQVVLEVFGSPFMRSVNVVVALLFGYLVAAVSKNDGNDYVNSAKIDSGEFLTPGVSSQE